MAGSDKITLRHLRMSMEKCKENVDKLNSQIKDDIAAVKIVYIDKLLKYNTMDDIIREINNQTRKTIYEFGAGDYVYNTNISLHDNVIIKGQGTGLTSLIYRGSVSQAISINDCENAGVLDFTLSGFTSTGERNQDVTGIEIKTTSLDQSGGSKLHNIKVEGFYNGITIGNKVYTLDILNVRVYSCFNYGISNNGTDNQFNIIVTQGNWGGNLYKGNNNCYNNIYSIYDGKDGYGDFSNKFIGHRNIITGFSTQDSRKPLIFENYKGSFDGMFDGYQQGLDPMPDYYVQINNSYINGHLNLNSYQGGGQVDTLVYMDSSSIFIGGIIPSEDLTGVGMIDGVLPNILNFNSISDPYANIVTNQGFNYEYDSTTDIMKISRNISYGNSTFRNFIMPNENSVWVFKGKIRKSADSTATKLVAFNNSGSIEPAYGTKVVVKKITTDWTYFTIAISRKTNQIGLYIDGADNDTNGYVEICNLKAIDVTDSWLSYSFTIPPIIKF